MRVVNIPLSSLCVLCAFACPLRDELEIKACRRHRRMGENSSCPLCLPF